MVMVTMKRLIVCLIALSSLVGVRTSSALLVSTSSGGFPEISGCNSCNSLATTTPPSQATANRAAIVGLDLHYSTTTACPTVTPPNKVNVITSIQGQVNGSCTASVTPFSCCTGSGTGTCGLNGFGAGFLAVTGSTPYIIDLQFGTVVSNWYGGNITISGTSNYNGTYHMLTEVTNRHYQLASATIPSATKETAGSAQMGEVWGPACASGTVTDGVSGNYCSYVFLNPSGIGADAFTWGGAAATAAYDVDMFVQNAALTGNISDVTCTSSNSGGTRTGTIVGPVLNVPNPGDDVISLIFADNLGNTGLVGNQSLPLTTLNVTSTSTYSATGAIEVDGNILTYTGKTSTTFTGIQTVVVTNFNMLNGDFVSGFGGIGQLSNDTMGGLNQLNGGVSGVQLPCIEYGTNSSALVYPFNCDGTTFLTNHFGALEVWGQPAGVLDTETVTTPYINNWIVDRVAIKPTQPVLLQQLTASSLTVNNNAWQSVTTNLPANILPETVGTVTVTWPTPELDGNYSATCLPYASETTNVSVLGISSKTAANMTVTVANTDPTATLTGTDSVSCVVMHQ